MEFYGSGQQVLTVWKIFLFQQDEISVDDLFSNWRQLISCDTMAPDRLKSLLKIPYNIKKFPLTL